MVQVADDDCTSICCTPLPLRAEECTILQQDADNRLELVGYYGSSLRRTDWNCEAHPPFAAFCSGVLFVPGRLGHDDKALEAEIPPRLPNGLDIDLCWQPDEALVGYRSSAALACDTAVACASMRSEDAA